MPKGNPHLDERELRAATSMVLMLRPSEWTVEPTDIAGAPPGTHDFNLRHEEVTAAVEVSTFADTDTIASLARWQRWAPDGTVTLTSLTLGWEVLVRSQGNYRMVRRNLEKWLHDLESRGEHSAETREWERYAFAPTELQPANLATLRAMASAGVVHANEAGDLLPGRCILNFVSDGHSYSPADRSYATSFVSAQLADLHRSDVEKLARAVADRRLLFLWLDPDSHFDVVRALDGGVPTGSVENAEPLDEVWIGRHFRDASVKVYRWQREDGWSSGVFLATDLDL